MPQSPLLFTPVQQRRAFIVDAMIGFSALPLDLRETPITTLLASSNTCLEGVPGIAFVLIEKSYLEHAKRAPVIEALRFLEAEGGPASRLQRYQENLRTLTEGIRRLGFCGSFDERIQAPVIIKVLTPEGPRFYGGPAVRGFIIYRSKLSRAQSFRIACIGALHTEDFDCVVAAIADILADFRLDDLSSCGGVPCPLQ
jgi:2-aminoethylphosphonate-pyruvate transaminase